MLFEKWSGEAARALESFEDRYGSRREGEPQRLDKALIRKRSATGFNLVRDLHDVWLLVNESMISIVVLKQAGDALRDRELQAVLNEISDKNGRQLSWLMTRIKQAAPQALIVPS